MNSREFRRLVIFLLLPCFFLDPATASAFSGTFWPKPISGTSIPVCFDVQTLNLASTFAHQKILARQALGCALFSQMVLQRVPAIAGEYAGLPPNENVMAMSGKRSKRSHASS